MSRSYKVTITLIQESRLTPVELERSLKRYYKSDPLYSSVDVEVEPLSDKYVQQLESLESRSPETKEVEKDGRSPGEGLGGF